MRYGFVKTACATPDIRVADCTYNAAQTIHAVEQAAEQKNKHLKNQAK